MLPEEVLDRLAASPAAIVAAAAFGALLGSFANVCIARIPRGMSIVRPPSHCFACGAPVRWFDNLPLVSWLILRGRCRRCGARYSARYLLVEAATGLLVGALWPLCLEVLHVGDPFPVRLARWAVYTLLALTLVVLTFIDLDHKRIPDRITYPGIPLFFVLGRLLGDVPLLDAVLGVVVGYGVVRALSDGYYWLTGREGLGYGDGKLLALIGGLLGWQAVLFTLFGGSLLGSVIGVSAVAIARRRGGARATPAEEVESSGNAKNAQNAHNAEAEEPEKSEEGPAGDGTAEADEPPPLRHVELPFGPFLVGAALVYLFLQGSLGVAFAVWLGAG